MFTPLILFFGLTVATAVIAHWSDNLGKKLGKKRVSLMGLRPRTTATVLTIASSWCIMLFTLVALLGAVKPLRKALFSYDKERAQAESDRVIAKNDIEAARNLLRETRVQFGAANQQLGAARGQLSTAKNSVAASQQAVREARQAGQRAEAARKRTDIAVKQAQIRLADAEKRLAVAQKREAAALQSEKTAQGETQAAKRETQAAQQERQVAQRATKEARESLKNAAASALSAGRTSIAAARREILAVQSEAKARKSEAAAKKSEANSKKSEVAARNRLRTTAQQIAVLKNEGTLLEVRLKELRTQLDEVRSDAEKVTLFARNDAPIKVAQVFAATRIAANQPSEAIVTQLREVLQQGRDSFARSEDTAPEPNFPAEASLQLFPVDATDATGKPVTLQGEELLQFYANAVRRQTTAKLVSVRLRAMRNYLAGEREIGVQFEFAPVKSAFAAGSTLASITIDGAQGDARIFSSLLDLLEFGQIQAKKRGVDPLTSLSNADFYAEDTKPKLFEALRRIEGAKSRLTVNLVTARALTTVEQLQVRFEIEGLEGKPTS